MVLKKIKSSRFVKQFEGQGKEFEKQENIRKRFRRKALNIDETTRTIRKKVGKGKKAKFKKVTVTKKTPIFPGRFL